MSTPRLKKSPKPKKSTKPKTKSRKDVTLTRDDLANTVSAKYKLPHETAYKILDLILDTMTETLKKGHRIELRHFGSFHTTPIKARAFQMPDGKKIKVPAFVKTIFRPGEGMTF